MGVLEHSIEVARDPEEVWSLVGDFDNDDRWRSVEEMRSVPPGPARVGTKTHEVLRFLGSTYVTDATVTTVEPGRSLAYEGGGEGTTVRGYRRVESVAGGARFVEGLEVDLAGPMRLLEPVISRLYGRRMGSETRALKRLLEDRPEDRP
jgi:uncharacterized protein YndB with AHSA1/START domain